jgi:hypothetical protein
MKFFINYDGIWKDLNKEIKGGNNIGMCQDVRGNFLFSLSQTVARIPWWSLHDGENVFSFLNGEKYVNIKVVL